MNEIPGYPEWCYEVAIRQEDGTLTVEVQSRTGEQGFEIAGVKTWAEVHPLAIAAIKEREQVA